jgi:hypothetical protein
MFLNMPKQYMQLLGWQKGQELMVYPAPNEKQALLIKKLELPEKK